MDGEVSGGDEREQEDESVSVEMRNPPLAETAG